MHLLGFFRGGWTILQEEGVRGLWKGVTASLWREGTYSTLRMGLYEPLRNFLHGESKDPIPLWKRILAGGGAGIKFAKLTCMTIGQPFSCWLRDGRGGNRQPNRLDQSTAAGR